MTWIGSTATSRTADRVDWVDYAKGLCIVLVVMMHSTLGVEQAAGREGFMHALVAFAKPFRMPDFFLIAGLFLARVIDRDWRSYLDRKLVPFAYFYVLWMTIQVALKAPLIAQEQGWSAVAVVYLVSFVEPFGTLWFIYLLPIYFVVTKLARGLPPALVWLAAAALELAPIATGSTLIDEFAGRFVYFYTGYLLAPRVFALAELVQSKPWDALPLLVAWAFANAYLVISGHAEQPVISLALGLAGAAAVVSVSALMAKSEAFAMLRYCGRHSIVIYLAFFLPMAAARTILIRTDVVPDVGAISLIVTMAGIFGALALWWLARATRLAFLFARPAQVRLPARPRALLQPAE